MDKTNNIPSTQPTTEHNTNTNTTTAQPSTNDFVTKADLKSVLSEILATQNTSSTSPATAQTTKQEGDVFENIRTRQENEEQIKKEHEMLSANYAEVLTDFKAFFKDKSDEYLSKVSALPLTDRINTLAKEIIRKAKGDVESTKSLLASFDKQYVFDKASAFNVFYIEALNKLREQNNPLFIPQANNTNNYKASDLKVITKGLFNSNTRKDALSQAKNLQLVA